jgi:hypothetical protein
LALAAALDAGGAARAVAIGGGFESATAVAPWLPALAA